MSDTILFAGARGHILVSGEQTQGAWGLLRNTQPPGNATPPHLHRREIEVPFVLSGELTIETGGRRRGLTSGGALALPKNRPHRLSNAGTVETHYLLMCAPAGFERFAAEVGERANHDAPAKPMTDDDRRRLARIAPSYGIELLGEEALRDQPVGAEPDSIADVFEAMGIRVEVLAETGPDHADPALLRAVLPPGAVVPLHSHPEPESFVVLEGWLDVHVDGVWHHGEAGAHIFVPMGARHAIRNPGDGPTTVICVTALSLAKFLRALGEPVGAPPMPAAEQKQRFIEIALAHGHTLYGPEDQAAAGFPLGPAV